MNNYLVFRKTFSAEIFEQDSSNLDIDSLFAKIPFDETIKICTDGLFENKDIAHGLKKK